MEGPRLVRREEIGDLSELLCRVFGFHEMYDKAEFTKCLRRPVHLRSARVIAEDGKPVSHIFTAVGEVSIHGCRVKVGSLGGVSTHPSYRQRGYAGRVFQKTLEDVTAAGARIMIVSGDRSLYRRHHCVPAGILLETTISRDSLPQPREGLSARPVTADDWPLLSPLYAAEPVRFARAAGFFSECCCWWDCVSPEIWLIASHAEPLAYLVLVPPWGERGRPVRTLFEYAGCRGAVLEALPLIFQQSEVAEIRLQLPGHDRELVYLLRARGLPLAPDTLSGTHRLLNLPGLMRDLRSYLAARLPRPVLEQLGFDQMGETCRFSLGQRQIELSLSQAIALILGGADAPRAAGDLGEVLTTIFPLPFPMPGFNFV